LHLKQIIAADPSKDIEIGLWKKQLEKTLLVWQLEQLEMGLSNQDSIHLVKKYQSTISNFVF